MSAVRPTGLESMSIDDVRHTKVPVFVVPTRCPTLPVHELDTMPKKNRRKLRRHSHKSFILPVDDSTSDDEQEQARAQIEAEPLPGPGAPKANLSSIPVETVSRVSSHPHSVKRTVADGTIITRLPTTSTQRRFSTSPSHVDDSAPSYSIES